MCRTTQQYKPLFLKEKNYKYLENQLPKRFFRLQLHCKGPTGKVSRIKAGAETVMSKS
jgi:hypothetical protein